MASLRAWRAACVIVAVLGLISCYQDTLHPVNCTEIGCGASLQVRLGSKPVGAYTVEVLRPSASSLVWSCDGVQPCMETAYFDYSEPSAQIRVTTTNGSVTTSVNIHYVNHRPNGPDCPPVCKSGVVTVPIPA